MAETLVKNRICNACGSEVRANALFCYHCGGSVAPEVVVALKDKEAISDVWLRENMSEEKNGNETARNAQSIVADAVDKPIPKPALPAEEPKLQSAAAMRRKPKNLQPKNVEIIWEEPVNAPNVWFILAGVLMTLFAAVILYLAIQLK